MVVDLFNDLCIPVRDKGYLRNASVMRFGDVETVDIKAASTEEACNTGKDSKSVFDQNGKNVSFFWIHSLMVFGSPAAQTFGYRLSVKEEFVKRGKSAEIRRNPQKHPIKYPKQKHPKQKHLLTDDWQPLK